MDLPKGASPPSNIASTDLSISEIMSEFKRTLARGNINLKGKLTVTLGEMSGVDITFHPDPEVKPQKTSCDISSSETFDSRIYPHPQAAYLPDRTGARQEFTFGVEAAKSGSTSVTSSGFCGRTANESGNHGNSSSLFSNLKKQLPARRRSLPAFDNAIGADFPFQTHIGTTSYKDISSMLSSKNWKSLNPKSNESTDNVTDPIDNEQTNIQSHGPQEYNANTETLKTKHFYHIPITYDSPSFLQRTLSSIPTTQQLSVDKYSLSHTPLQTSTRESVTSPINTAQTLMSQSLTISTEPTIKTELPSFDSPHTTPLPTHMTSADSFNMTPSKSTLPTFNSDDNTSASTTSTPSFDSSHDTTQLLPYPRAQFLHSNHNTTTSIPQASPCSDHNTTPSTTTPIPFSDSFQNLTKLPPCNSSQLTPCATQLLPDCITPVEKYLPPSNEITSSTTHLPSSNSPNITTSTTPISSHSPSLIQSPMPISKEQPVFPMPLTYPHLPTPASSSETPELQESSLFSSQHDKKSVSLQDLISGVVSVNDLKALSNASLVKLLVEIIDGFKTGLFNKSKPISVSSKRKSHSTSKVFERKTNKAKRKKVDGNDKSETKANTDTDKALFDDEEIETSPLEENTDFNFAQPLKKQDRFKQDRFKQDRFKQDRFRTETSFIPDFADIISNLDIKQELTESVCQSQNLEAGHQSPKSEDASRKNNVTSEELGTKKPSSKRTPRFSCKNCPEVFSDKAQYRKHIKIHSLGFQCDVCGKTLKTKDSLYHHHRGLHSGLKPYHCQECNKSFNFHHSYKLHLHKHSGARPHECKECHKTYLTAHHLKVHTQAAHSAPGSKPCPICGKTFSYHSSLQAHIQSHSDVKPFECDKCGKGFITKQRLDKHRESHLEGKQFQCKICGKMYKSESSRNAHYKLHQPKMKKHMCDTCGKTFVSTGALKAHAVLHGEERPYVCQVCGKTFRSQASLCTHRYVHVDTTDFVCGMCGKSFKSKILLDAHMKRHTNDKSFACQTCGNTFPDKGGLSKHMKTVHLPKKQFVCTICGKRGTRADNMRTHIKSHKEVADNNLNLMDFIREENVSSIDIQTAASAPSRIKNPKLKKLGDPTSSNETKKLIDSDELNSPQKSLNSVSVMNLDQMSPRSYMYPYYQLAAHQHSMESMDLSVSHFHSSHRSNSSQQSAEDLVAYQSSLYQHKSVADRPVDSLDFSFSRVSTTSPSEIAMRGNHSKHN